MSFKIEAFRHFIAHLIGVPGILFISIRYLLRSPVLIAIIEKRKEVQLAEIKAKTAKHVSDNKLRMMRLKLKSKEKIAKYNFRDTIKNSIDRQ